MANDPIRTAAAAESGLLEDTLLEATIKRTIYVLNVGELWADFDQPTGEKRLAILDAATSYLYLYDASDTTTADDGLTCRVTGTGERYHIEDAASISLSSVLGVTATPPGSPSVGDVYICDTASTGAWSGHDTDLAVYTRRGWVFAEPEVGMTVLNLGTGANIQFDDNGDWVPFAIDIADDSLRPSQLMHPAGLVVEAQQNAPPSVPADPATTYLVGTAGSGAWSGHNNAIAYSVDGTNWSFIAPTEGMTVYNKATDFAYRYSGTAWVAVVTGVDYQVFTTPGAATWTKPSGISANALVLVELWAGGGPGGNAGANNGGGGGGGGHRAKWFRAGELGATESLTIGAGGTAGVRGGDTSFGSHMTAYGGGYGNGVDPGGGGGKLGQGTNGSGGGSAGQGGPPANGTQADQGGGNGASSGSGTGGSSVDGGGGGGSGNGPGNSNGGASENGGGGGANGGGTGGASKRGGSGGNAGQAGNAPGGGGGGKPAGSGALGIGARGEIRVTTIIS